MRAPRDSIPALRAVLTRFSAMSGQRVNLGKSTVILLGDDAQGLATDGSDADPSTWWPGMPFTTAGVCIEKYHGVELCQDADAAKRAWERKAAEVKSAIATDAKAFVPRSLAGRRSLAHGRYAGKLMHTFKYQVPAQTDLDATMADLQRGGDLGAGAGFSTGGPLGLIQQILELDLGLFESRGVDVRQVIGNYI